MPELLEEREQLRVGVAVRPLRAFDHIGAQRLETHVVVGHRRSPSMRAAARTDARRDVAIQHCSRFSGLMRPESSRLSRSAGPSSTAVAA